MSQINGLQVLVDLFQAIVSGVVVGLVIFWMDERRVKRERRLADFRTASNWIKKEQKESLRSFDLSHANLSGHNFVEANLEDAKFDKTELWGTKFTKANLRRTSFRMTKMLGTEFQKVIAFEADFSRSKIDKRIYPDKKVFVNFTGAALQGASFRESSINGASFASAKLHEVDFSNAIVLECDFTGSDLTGSKWKKVKRVENCIWKNIKVDDSDIFPPYLWKEIQRQNEK